MQFIPSTWSVVGVDADNDGLRNPHDIDDAALAAAVYLCSGSEDLARTPGLRTAIFRYNHSTRYVDLVLSIARGYLDGEFTSVPNGTTSAGYMLPAEPASRRRTTARATATAATTTTAAARTTAAAARTSSPTSRTSRTPSSRTSPMSPTSRTTSPTCRSRACRRCRRPRSRRSTRSSPHGPGDPAVHARGLRRQHPAGTTTRSTSACTTTRTSPSWRAMPRAEERSRRATRPRRVSSLLVRADDIAARSTSPAQRRSSRAASAAQ